MDFLKPLFGDGALTFEQFCEKTRGEGRDGADMKLTDLSQGGYVGLEKHRAAVAQRNELRQKLEEAGGVIEALESDGSDAAALRSEAEKWRRQADEARAEAESTLRDIALRAAMGQAAEGLEFSSASARRAFLDAVRGAELPLVEGRLEGFEAFAEAYREEDPGAFVPEEPVPRFSAPVAPPAGGDGWRERAARNYAKAKAPT